EGVVELGVALGNLERARRDALELELGLDVLGVEEEDLPEVARGALRVFEREELGDGEELVDGVVRLAELAVRLDEEEARVDVLGAGLDGRLGRLDDPGPEPEPREGARL